MLGELGAALEALSSDSSVRVIVLTGEGRAFSAGVDLKALAAGRVDGGSVSDLLNANARNAIRLLTTVPQVTIAKINGFCFTGALELALACDLIVVADEAKLGDTHAKWGLRPTWGMSQRLIRAVGVARARDLSFTARTFSGQEAAAWGLAVSSVPLADLDAAVDELAASIVENSAGSIAAYKDLYRRAARRRSRGRPDLRSHHQLPDRRRAGAGRGLPLSAARRRRSAAHAGGSVVSGRCEPSCATRSVTSRS